MRQLSGGFVDARATLLRLVADAAPANRHVTQPPSAGMDQQPSSWSVQACRVGWAAASFRGRTGSLIALCVSEGTMAKGVGRDPWHASDKQGMYSVSVVHV